MLRVIGVLGLVWGGTGCGPDLSFKVVDAATVDGAQDSNTGFDARLLSDAMLIDAGADTGYAMDGSQEASGAAYAACKASMLVIAIENEIEFIDPDSFAKCGTSRASRTLSTISAIGLQQSANLLVAVGDDKGVAVDTQSDQLLFEFERPLDQYQGATNIFLAKDSREPSRTFLSVAWRLPLGDGENASYGTHYTRDGQAAVVWDAYRLPGNARSFATDPADRTKIWAIYDGGADTAFGYDPIEGILTGARIPFTGLPNSYLEDATHLEVKRFGQNEVRMTVTVPEALSNQLPTVYYSTNGGGFVPHQACTACEGLRRSLPHPSKDQHAFLLCDTGVGPSVFEQDLSQTKLCNPVIWGDDLAPLEVTAIATSSP